MRQIKEKDDRFSGIAEERFVFFCREFSLKVNVFTSSNPFDPVMFVL